MKRSVVPTGRMTSGNQAATIVWFRQDLRLQDNPALAAAWRQGGAVIPVYIWDEAGEAAWPLGGASRWWLHHSLRRLDESLRRRGSRLLLRQGAGGAVLAALAKETGATAIYWNRRHEPAGRTREFAITAALLKQGVGVQGFNSALTMLDRAGGSSGEISQDNSDFGSSRPAARQPAMAGAGKRGDLDDEIPF